MPSGTATLLVGDGLGHTTTASVPLTVNEPAGPSPMLVGLSTPASVPWATAVARAGPLDIRHQYWQAAPWSFSTGGAPATIGSIKPAASMTETALKAAAGTFLDQVPTTHPFELIGFHEPEDEIEKQPGGGFSLQTYLNWQTWLRAVVNQKNAARQVPIKFGGTLMAYSTEKASGRNIDDYIPPAGTWDFLGWDGYDRAYGNTGTSESLQSIMSQPVSTKYPKGGPLQTNLRYGLPFLVIETGTTGAASKYQGGIGAGEAHRVQWLNDGLPWARSVGCISFTYWNNDLWDLWQLDTDAEYQALGAWAQAA